MQSIRNSISSHIRLRGSAEQFLFPRRGNVFKQLHRQMCTSAGTSPDKIMDRVIGLVKKVDKIDATKVILYVKKRVTETADFQKDLCLYSLDRVELVMAFEEEFSIEIPEEKADKLTCCVDVARYIVSGGEQKNVNPE
ncbi:hypothetical protein OIU78_003884 [Salix suchowensis]|nr:hypothetical protein OIU78_003884 [Salix suchowensis]